MSCPLLLDCPSISDVSVLELIYSPLGRVIGGLNRGSISSHMGGGLYVLYHPHWVTSIQTSERKNSEESQTGGKSMIRNRGAASHRHPRATGTGLNPGPQVVQKQTKRVLTLIQDTSPFVHPDNLGSKDDAVRKHEWFFCFQVE
ncbi:hypothetical protein D4764_18G0009940 [Takifugu flavidus]|uniref:Uncharacterized protein n=1 Tax=Takifugu flavidus TaxID=433684 RepID=A0A5C6NTQ0_9TELE|nr:hypothetical protein D4764_18G0009940 [Takifugu flavidus]